MDHLPHRPAAFAIRRIELLRGKSVTASRSRAGAGAIVSIQRCRGLPPKYDSGALEIFRSDNWRLIVRSYRLSSDQILVALALPHHAP